MKVLVVYCHPCPESLTAAVRDRVLGALGSGGHDVKVSDLYADGFDPVMDASERRGYHTPGDNEVPVAGELEKIRWAEAVVFVYPTWWFGLPAMLKGWLDRVWVPHATFVLPEKGKPVRRVLDNIRLVAAVSTCGAPWWLLKFIGDPGRRTLLRGMRHICAPGCKTLWLAHYEIDSSTPESRARFLDRVERRLARI